VHKFIFSDKEREMIKLFLKTGNRPKTNHFNVTLTRTKMYELTLIEDFDLLIKLLTSIKETKKRTS